MAKRLKTLEDKMVYRLNRSKADVFMRGDFEDLAGYDQIGRALNHLVKAGKLVKIGYGLYARARISSISRSVIPSKPLPDLAKEALKKMKIKTKPSRALEAYNSGSTTQIPTGRTISVKSRISRRIGYAGKYIKYERVA